MSSVSSSSQFAKTVRHGTAGVALWKPSNRTCEMRSVKALGFCLGLLDTGYYARLARVDRCWTRRAHLHLSLFFFVCVCSMFVQALLVTRNLLKVRRTACAKDILASSCHLDLVELLLETVNCSRFGEGWHARWLRGFFAGSR